MRGGGHAREQLATYLTSHVVPLLKSNDPDDAQRPGALRGSRGTALPPWVDGVRQRRARLGAALPHPVAPVGPGRREPRAWRARSGRPFRSGHAHREPGPGGAAREGWTRRASRQGPLDRVPRRPLRAPGSRRSAMGDAGPQRRSVHLSETAFERVRAEDEPEWARFIDPAYLNGEYAHTFRDLERPDEAARFAGLSIAEAERQNRARRGSMAQAALARAAIDSHDLEAAASAGMAAAKLAATVKSSRSVEAVSDLRTRLRDHKDSPAIREFLDVSGALLPAMGPRS